MLWSLLLLLGLVAAEGLFPISLPKNEIPRHLRILGRKMDSIFVFFFGARKNKKYRGKRAEEPLKNLAVFMTRVERSSARNKEKFCWTLDFFFGGLVLPPRFVAQSTYACGMAAKGSVRA